MSPSPRSGSVALADVFGGSWLRAAMKRSTVAPRPSPFAPIERRRPGGKGGGGKGQPKVTPMFALRFRGGVREGPPEEAIAMSLPTQFARVAEIAGNTSIWDWGEVKREMKRRWGRSEAEGPEFERDRGPGTFIRCRPRRPLSRELWPHQVDICAAVERDFADQISKYGSGSCLVRAGCGMGKTGTTASMWSASPEVSTGQVMVVVGKKDLLPQWASDIHSVATLKGEGARPPAIGLVGEGRFLVEGAKYIIVMAMTLSNIVERALCAAPDPVAVDQLAILQRCPAIVFDEAHHATASTWLSILRAFSPRYWLSLTATPSRSDGTNRQLRDLLGHQSFSISSPRKLSMIVIPCSFFTANENHRVFARGRLRKAYEGLLSGTAPHSEKQLALSRMASHDDAISAAAAACAALLARNGVKTMLNVGVWAELPIVMSSLREVMGRVGDDEVERGPGGGDGGEGADAASEKKPRAKAVRRRKAESEMEFATRFFQAKFGIGPPSAESERARREAEEAEREASEGPPPRIAVLNESVRHDPRRSARAKRSMLTVATLCLVNEGFDDKRLDAAVVHPVQFRGNLEQYLGRFLRNSGDPAHELRRKRVVLGLARTIPSVMGSWQRVMHRTEALGHRTVLTPTAHSVEDVIRTFASEMRRVPTEESAKKAAEALLRKPEEARDRTAPRKKQRAR